MSRIAHLAAAAAALLLIAAPDLTAAQPALPAPIARPHCITPAAAARIETLAAEALATGTPALSLAIRCDAGSFQRAWGVADLATGERATPDTAFRLASVTKQFTAAAVLKLAEQGKLSLDDRLSVYAPELPGAENITLYQLLTHTSGLADFTEAPDYEEHRARDHSRAEMIAWIGALKPNFAPGEAWRYSNSGYIMLGVVIERVTGQDLQSAFGSLLGPAFTLAFDLPGAPRPASRALGYHTRDGSSPPVVDPAAPISMTIPLTAGALRGPPAAVTEWVRELFSGRVVGTESLALLTAAGRLADGRNSREGMPPQWREGLKADSGMGFFMDQAHGRRRYLHGGDIDGFSSWMAWYPDQRVSLAIVVNSDTGAMRAAQIEAAVLEGLELRGR